MNMETVYKYRENLRTNKEARTYLINRGFDNVDFLINNYNIGCDKKYILFPNIYKDKVVFLTSRSYNESTKMKHKHTKGKIEYFFNQSVIENYNDIIITESPIDCLSACYIMKESRYGIIGCYGIGGYPKQLEFLHNKNIYILFDYDKAGKDGAINISKNIYKQLGIICNIVTIHDTILEKNNKVDLNLLLQTYNNNLKELIEVFINISKKYEHKEVVEKYDPINTNSTGSLISDSFSIQTVCSKFMSLKNTGKGVWKGCCPFHDDSDPSFIVYENTNRFHCFGCKKRGSPIGFIIELYPHLNYHQAIQFLKGLF